MFTKAIVKTPCRNFVNGLTTSTEGKPDYERALAQHQNYINALKQCGLKVFVMDADDNYPDSTFVEDTALLTPECAIITNPGAPTRKGEIDEMKIFLGKFYPYIEIVKAPATVEAGDIMMVGAHFFIGLSERTNRAGAEQIIRFLEKYGMSGSIVKFEDVLHLKTGVAYLENNNLLAVDSFACKPEFTHFNILKVEEDEGYAANCIWVNGTVIVPEGYPKTRKTIEMAGYKTIAVNVSEFRKLDGGLSCLSLRF
ncbi:MAG: arginine deiminase family protein [Bacteroidales bacterium]